MPRASTRLAAILLCTAPLGHADDVVVGTGHGASCDEAALDAGLQQLVVGTQAPGGTLTFDCGAGPRTIAISTPKLLSGQIAIDGGNLVTLDAQDLVRHFQLAVDGPEGRTEVSIRNLSLTRGFAPGSFGGAILAGSGVQLELRRVAIRDSRAGISGGALGIEPGNTQLTVFDSEFTQNRAPDGGAIATSAFTVIRNSRFFGNSADGDQGGAIQSWVEDLRIEDSRFAFNAAARGGAIYKRQQELEITGSRFADNLARADGGAVYTEAGVERFSLLTSRFDRNFAADEGGAIFAGKAFNAFICGFDANRADRGGALHLSDSEFSFVAFSTFAHNEAEFAGGAIAAIGVTQPPGDPAVLSVSQVTFAENRVTAGSGGDIHLTNAGAGLLAAVGSSTLMGATASSGGFSIHAGPGNTALMFGSLLWTPGSDGCFAEINSTITSAGNNLGPTAACRLDDPSDGGLFMFSDFELEELAYYGGPLRTYRPRAASLAVDRRSCEGLDPIDARLLPRGIDADGDGQSQCDSGAVELQGLERPGSLFRSGFEPLTLPGGS